MFQVSGINTMRGLMGGVQPNQGKKRMRPPSSSDRDCVHKRKKTPGVLADANSSPIPRILPSYYINNFLLVLGITAITHNHLLTNREKELLRKFVFLSEPAQRIFVRLFYRKGPWFKPFISGNRRLVNEFERT